MTARTHKDIASFFYAQLAGVLTSTVGFALLLLVGALALGVSGDLLDMSQGITVDGLQKLGTAVMVWVCCLFFGVPVLGGAVAGATRAVFAPRLVGDAWTQGLGSFAAGSLCAALCYTPMLILHVMGMGLMVSRGQYQEAFFGNQNMMFVVSTAMLTSGVCAFVTGRVTAAMRRGRSSQSGTIAAASSAQAA